MKHPLELVLVALLSLPIASASVHDGVPATPVSDVTAAETSTPFRRFLDNSKTIECRGAAGSIEVVISNGSIEFGNVPPGATYTGYAIVNGVGKPPPDSYAVEQASGTINYGSPVLLLPGRQYPITVERRIDTIVAGAVVYRSSLSIACDGPSASPIPATPTNVDLIAHPEPPLSPTTPFRRWLPHAKVFTCAGEAPAITVTASNGNIEFGNLPAGATYLETMIVNGVTTFNGPYPVEQLTGAIAYAPLRFDTTAFPVAIEHRIDTVVGDATVYRSSLKATCDGPATVMASVINVDLIANPEPTPNPEPTSIPFRRWVDGITLTCAGPGPGTVTSSSGNVEFSGLAADAEYIDTIVINGEGQVRGPFNVEQTQGVKAYFGFQVDFDAYPVTFEHRIDTIVGGDVVYRSTISIACTGPGTAMAPVVNLDLRDADPPTPPGGPDAIVPTAPTRYLDTRGLATFDGTFDGGGRAGVSSVVRVAVTTRSGGPVPTDAVGVVANVAVVAPGSAGYATLFSCAEAAPTASHLNFLPGEVSANTAVVPLSPGGELCIFSSVDADYVVDVNGYVPAGSPVVLFEPARYLDTRPGAPLFDGTSGGNELFGGGFVEVPTAGRGGVPTDAAAVFASVTAVSFGAPGFVSMYPCVGDPAAASTLNYAPWQFVPNGVIARLSPEGSVCVFTLAPGDLIVDVAGYVPASASSLTTRAAVRVFDSRPGEQVTAGGPAPGRLGAGDVREVQVTGRAGVPADASAAMLNVAVVAPDEPGFVTLWPCGERPETSNLNYAAGGVRANNSISKLSSAGTVCLYTLAGADVLIDITGWLT